MHTVKPLFSGAMMLLLSLAVSTTACKKDDPEPPVAPTPVTPGGGEEQPDPSTTPNFSDADGSLWAVRSLVTQDTPIGQMDVQIGLGVAVFTDDDFLSFEDVGAVSLNGTDLTRNSNNAYASQPSQTQPTGIDVSSGATWVVEGGSGFDGFTRSINSFPLPEVEAITSGATVVRSNGYTVSTTSVAGADSVMFLVGDVTKTLGGNATTCTFSADELAGLAAGTNMVQVAAYRFVNEMIGGKNIYFGKETVRSKSVTIQ